MRSKDERDRAVPCQSAKLVDKIGFSLQFGDITTAKFLPAIGSVTEPLPQFGAGRDVLRPHIDRGRRFLTPRGHRRSTRMRVPSPVAGGSYARFSLMFSGEIACFIGRLRDASALPGCQVRSEKTLLRSKAPERLQVQRLRLVVPRRTNLNQPVRRSRDR
jgi:hypothetical protein